MTIVTLRGIVSARVMRVDSNWVKTRHVHCDVAMNETVEAIFSNTWAHRRGSCGHDEVTIFGDDLV